MNRTTLVVNLFAGPGAGETTCAWEIASELKKRNIEAEYVGEYAKELVWDGRTDLLDGSLKNQTALYNEQARRINRLIGKVDVVVTDSPAVLSLMYLKEANKAFENRALDEFRQYNNFNLFINRSDNFQTAGRIHTETESKALDDKIKGFLNDKHIYYGTYYHKTVGVLVDNIEKNLRNIQQNPENLQRQQKIKGNDELIAENTQTKYTLYRAARAIPFRCMEQIRPNCTIAFDGDFTALRQFDFEDDALEHLADCKTEVLLLDDKKAAVVLEFYVEKSVYDKDGTRISVESLGVSNFSLDKDYLAPAASNVQLAEHLYNVFEGECNEYIHSHGDTTLWCGSFQTQVNAMRQISNYLQSQSPYMKTYRLYDERTAAFENLSAAMPSEQSM